MRGCLGASFQLTLGCCVLWGARTPSALDGHVWLPLARAAPWLPPSAARPHHTHRLLAPPCSYPIELLPPLLLRQVFDAAMARAKARAPGGRPGPAVTAAFINPQRRFGFVELRSMEEAANGLVLNGMRCGGEQLEVRVGWGPSTTLLNGTPFLAAKTGLGVVLCRAALVGLAAGAGLGWQRLKGGSCAPAGWSACGAPCCLAANAARHIVNMPAKLHSSLPCLQNCAPACHAHNSTLLLSHVYKATHVSTDCRWSACRCGGPRTLWRRTPLCTAPRNPRGMWTARRRQPWQSAACRRCQAWRRCS